MRHTILTLLLAIIITGCTTTRKDIPPHMPPKQAKIMSPATQSELALGKRLFQDGYYKRAMEQLLPLATEGVMEAQYAVGYMYYYGYGVPQDTASGNFWIKRSADQNFEPAIKALAIIHGNHQKFAKHKPRTSRD